MVVFYIWWFIGLVEIQVQICKQVGMVARGPRARNLFCLAYVIVPCMLLFLLCVDWVLLGFCFLEVGNSSRGSRLVSGAWYGESCFLTSLYLVQL